MRERVLYSDPAASADLAALAYEELGRVDNAVWLACPDHTVRALGERRLPLFLYFDRRSYDQAVAELSPTKVQEVIRHRRDRWMPQAKGYVMAWLLDLERTVLEGALRSGPGMAAETERSLSLLQRLSGLDRYSIAPAAAMGVTVLQGESLLLAAVQGALDSGIFEGTDDQSRLVAHRDRRRVWGQATSGAVAALGAPQFADALPFADFSRGVFLRPTDEAFAQGLLKTGESVVPWRDGSVFVSAGRRLERVRRNGQSLAILYADSAEFYSSAESLTTPQLHRDFAARLGRPAGEAGIDYLGHIDRLHLHQILMKRELAGRPDSAETCRAAKFDAILQGDIDLLARSLARSRSFSRSQGLENLEPASALFHAAAEMERADISLFHAIASRYWPALAPKLKEVEALGPLAPGERLNETR